MLHLRSFQKKETKQENKKAQLTAFVALKKASLISKQTMKAFHKRRRDFKICCKIKIGSKKTENS